MSTPIESSTDLDGLDADAMLERAQLLEPFGALERCRLERGQDEQRAAAVCVEPDVSIERRPTAARIAGVRDRRPEKYMANPPRSKTTLTTFASVSSDGFTIAGTTW